LVAQALNMDRVVFESGGDDPHQCCTTATADALTFECTFSGADLLVGSGSAVREGNELVVRFCRADLSTSSVSSRDEWRTRLSPSSVLHSRP
jgi:hypothetical protein